MIYFVYDASHRAIKIGFTEYDVKRRLKQLQWGTLARLELLATCEGDKTVEAELHGTFANLHISGEWFRDDPLLRNFIQQNTPAEQVVQRGRHAPKKDGYMNLREMCHYTQCTTAEVLFEVANNGFPHCHFGPHIYFPMIAVRKWMDEEARQQPIAVAQN